MLLLPLQENAAVTILLQVPGLRRGSAYTSGQNDLKAALKTVSFSKCHVAQTCQLVTAILHLDNLKFTISWS